MANGWPFADLAAVANQVWRLTRSTPKGRSDIDCLSAGSRKFVAQLDKPDADLIDGFSRPLRCKHRGGHRIAVRQPVTPARLLSILRLLFAQLASIVCPVCSAAVGNDNAQTVAARLNELASGARVSIHQFPSGTRSQKVYPTCLPWDAVRYSLRNRG